MTPNHRVNRTAHQRCWWVPSALRAPASGYAERYAPGSQRRRFLVASGLARVSASRLAAEFAVTQRERVGSFVVARRERWRRARGA